ncbi:aminotransferase class V-fold PLP-dependent enzyme [Tunicatimonas pelagia]|uniref:aminotransferase class V-fold PLP-dependent enzyme n=1 Tax=Tunicatimonas pelagia TaxID=931531 RepID=UPI002666C498|nr:aminotransferase class V-fold PLP-dependent enzyme [Tunicatimonas pelagia]WKN43688.1 aminotransferase class V-fold PLP-dependent enzyme [Tunicatimonas pelagia]
MITFYPGPSKVYPEVPDYVRDAYDAGVLSINHRSPEFMEIFQRTTQLVKEKLHIPEDYTVVFSSSATECWEIICQSLVEKKSFHMYNGAFGAKWLRYAQILVPTTESLAFETESIPEVNSIQVGDSELIALTHNETSNGTALPSDWMQELRARFPEILIAVDATSSMAGVDLSWEAADVWFASVQKCFGLPAGLAAMVLSPKAIERVQKIGNRGYYNSLLNIYEQNQHHQTTHTPNVLGIYLLMRVMEDREPISIISAEIKARYSEWKKMLFNLNYVKHIIHNSQVQSKTVITFQAEKEVINQIRQQARAHGIVLGNGYGKLKETTLRIANFPAITENDIHQLKEFFANFAPENSMR